MNAEPKNDKDLPKTDPNMKRAFFKSGIFHFCIFLLALFGLPFIAKDPPEIIMPVSVEMAEVAEKTQTNKVSPPKKVEKQPEIEKPEPPKKEPVKEVDAEEPPDLKPPEPPEPLPEPKKEEPKKEPEPKPKEKPKPKPEPKEEPKKEPERDFNSLLKDLTPDEEEEPTQEEKTQLAPLGERMTVSELDNIRRQIEPCWNFPIGAKNAEDLVVQLRIEIGRDMRINKADVIGNNSLGNPALKAAEDSALRAVRNPRCSQLQGLPADKYERWQTIILNLDPSTVL